ncbi:MAG: carbohydrate ABC transporter permease [Bacillota bacterium]|jgi:multiple sugar transport system permease protein
MSGIKGKLQKLLGITGIGMMAFCFLFPIILTFSNSLMTKVEIDKNYHLETDRANEKQKYTVLKLIPDQVTIKQYYTLLMKTPQYLLMFWNSVLLVAPIVAGQALVSMMAAYGFCWLDFKGRETLFFVYIVTMLMPCQVTLVPNYLVLSKLGLIGSYASIILPGVFNTFGVFLLRQSMRLIPREYLEAARVDGAGHLNICWRIVVPMVKPGLAALAILLAIDNWNMVEQPLIFLQEMSKQPLSIYLTQINKNDLGISFAAATIYMLPLLLLFLYGENYLIEGIELSGLKG